MSTSTLRIAMVGLSDRTENAIKLFLEKNFVGIDHVGFDDAPDCIIFDLDQPIGRSRWKRLLSATRRPCTSILVSLSGYGDADCKRMQKSCVSLRKPVRLGQLQEALSKLQGRRLRPAQATSALDKAIARRKTPVAAQETAAQAEEPKRPPSLHAAAQQLPGKATPLHFSSRTQFDPQDLDTLKKAQYDPAQYFQGYLTRLLAQRPDKQGTLTIWTPDGQIRLDLETGKANVHLSKYRFRTLCSIPSDPSHPTPWREVHDVEPPSGNPHRKETSIQGLEWIAAIWASRGRLPQHLDAQRPVHMRHWPNLTRLTAIPHAMNIAALWSQNDFSPLETARLLRIDPRHVFTFVSACDAIGVLQQAEPDSATESPPPKKRRAHKHRSLLGRLLAKISLFTNREDD